MSDFILNPDQFKPITNGYGMTAGNNVVGVALQGGLPRQSRDYDIDNRVVNVTLIVDKVKKQIFEQILKFKLADGANTFGMWLQTNADPEIHYGAIMAGTLRMNHLGGAGNYSITFDFMVEKTSLDNDSYLACDGVIDLMNCYGGTICNVFDSLAKAVKSVN